MLMNGLLHGGHVVCRTSGATTMDKPWTISSACSLSDRGKTLIGRLTLAKYLKASYYS